MEVIIDILKKIFKYFKEEAIKTNALYFEKTKHTHTTPTKKKSK